MSGCWCTNSEKMKKRVKLDEIEGMQIIVIENVSKHHLKSYTNNKHKYNMINTSVRMHQKNFKHKILIPNSPNSNRNLICSSTFHRSLHGFISKTYILVHWKICFNSISSWTWLIVLFDSQFTDHHFIKYDLSFEKLWRINDKSKLTHSFVILMPTGLR